MNTTAVRDTFVDKYYSKLTEDKTGGEDFAKVLGNFTDTQMVISTNANQNQSTQTTLSDQALEYLKTLEEKYPDTNFIIADFSSESQANELMKDSDSAFSCVIKPDLIEKMAADEEVRGKYEQIIEDADYNLRQVKEKLGDDAEYFDSFSYFVNEDGTVTYFAYPTENREAEKIEADSLEAFLEKLRQSPDSNSSDYNIHEEYYANLCMSS